jgi:hypothetical protein
MKKIAFVSLVSMMFAASASAQRPKVVRAQPRVAKAINCTTPGDALGGLQLYRSVGNVIVIKESTMAGTTTYEKAASTPEQISALYAGHAVNILAYNEKTATMFGGAISPATLVTLGAKGAQGRAGYMARKGVVYVLTCSN